MATQFGRADSGPYVKGCRLGGTGANPRRWPPPPSRVASVDPHLKCARPPQRGPRAHPTPLPRALSLAKLPRKMSVWRLDFLSPEWSLIDMVFTQAIYLRTSFPDSNSQIKGKHRSHFMARSQWCGGGRHVGAIAQLLRRVAPSQLPRRDGTRLNPAGRRTNAAAMIRARLRSNVHNTAATRRARARTYRRATAWLHLHQPRLGLERASDAAWD